MAKSEALLNQYRFNVSPGPHFDAGDSVPTLPDEKPVRLVAYYLPQFHAIAENDEWWGAGFTEWTNVTKAVPRFSDHYQPRLPGPLGFYDLSQPRMLQRQAEMARRYGLEAFCFHYYWFGGRKLLEKPLNNLLAHPEIDISFCVNWANENWTRRWDGQDQAVLMAQNHSPEDDIAFAQAMEPLFDDPRYLRVDGRPLLMLYHASGLPDAQATVDRWREYFGARNQELYVVTGQTFSDLDPRPYGMNAIAGFPPHGPGFHVKRRNPRTLFDPDYAGQIIPYEKLAAEAAANRPVDFRLLPGVCPGWDNEARRPGTGVVVHGSTPDLYGAWLERAGRWIMESAPAEERIVFINAWNEWAEGAYLEPDRHYGFAYLKETAETLVRLSKPPARNEARMKLSVPADPGAPTIVQRLAAKGARGAERAARFLRSI